MFFLGHSVDDPSLGAKSAMAKVIYGRSTQKSAMAMAIVASPVDPPLYTRGSVYHTAAIANTVKNYVLYKFVS